MNAKDGDEDDHGLGRLHHHVRVVAVEVVLKMQFGPSVGGQSMMPKKDEMRRPDDLTTLKRKQMMMRMVRMKMRRPDDFDNAEEEEDVDEDGENGGDG